MKRSQPTRKTPLAAGGAPLARKTPLAAKTPLATAKGLLRGERPPRPPRNTGPAVSVRNLVIERSAALCERCGQSLTGRPYSLHHRKPRGMGGTKDPAINSPANLAVLCGSATTPDGCHTAVERFRQAAMTTGWIVARTADPATIPIKRHNGWYLLGRDGGLTKTERPDGDQE